MEDGLHVYDNPVGVMTNNPPFPIMKFALDDYYALSSKSRFVRCVFTKYNSLCDKDEASSVNQFFKILSSVEQVKCLYEVTPGEYEYTIYSSCMNQEKGIYYYTTYGNPEVHAVDMHKTDLDGKELTSYKLQKYMQFHFDN